MDYKYCSKSGDELEESKEEYQERIQLALEKVRSWNLPENTDCCRKVLETVVRDNRQLEHIAYKPDIKKVGEQASPEVKCLHNR